MTGTTCNAFVASENVSTARAHERHITKRIGRYLSGQALALDSSATAVDARIQIASLHDCFVQDVLLLKDGILLGDDFEFDEYEVQIMLVEDKVHPEDVWVKVLQQAMPNAPAFMKALERLNKQMQKQRYERTASGTKKTVPLVDVGMVLGNILFDYLWVPSDELELEFARGDVDVNIVRALCESGADLNELRLRDSDLDEDALMWTPLCYAAARNLVDVVGVLLAHGACPWRTVFNAVESGNIQMLQLTLFLGHLDVNDAYEGMVPLFVAAFMGNEDICHFLLELGANVHVEVTGDANEMYMGRGAGRTSLHAAAVGGHEHICELLVQEGANVFHKDDDGHQALDVADDPQVRAWLKRQMRPRNRRSYK